MIPHLPLARTTAVERLEAASAESGASLWVKRDDRTSDLYGGNKVRKLEYLLGEARQEGCDTLVTAGATGSHHVLATTLFGTKWGFEVEAVMVRQPMTPHVEENLRCDLAAGAVLHPVRTWAGVAAKMTTLQAMLRAGGRRPYRVTYGGSSATGALGFVEAGLELAAQIERGELPEPDAIYVALGSGGTCAGLALGIRAAGLTTPIVAVRVTPLLVCNRATVAGLVGATIKKLRSLEAAFPSVGRTALSQIRVDGREYGRGYGTSSRRVDDAIALGARDGLVLDRTYTGRAFSAMLQDARGARAGQRLLFWQSLSSADLRPVLANAPGVPEWARA